MGPDVQDTISTNGRDDGTQIDRRDSPGDRSDSGTSSVISSGATRAGSVGGDGKRPLLETDDSWRTTTLCHRLLAIDGRSYLRAAHLRESLPEGPATRYSHVLEDSLNSKLCP